MNTYLRCASQPTDGPDGRRNGSARTSALVSAVIVAALLVMMVLGSCSSESDSAGSTTDPPTETLIEEEWNGPRVIIDTDLSKWWDDATAMGIANVLSNQDSLRVLGIVTDVPNAVAVAAIDATNTAYNNPDIPLGAMAGSDADTFDHGYTDALIEGLAHSVNHSDDVPEAVALYRRLLADAPDNSVTIAAIGGYTNLAGLLASTPDDVSDLSGRDLIGAKVNRLVINDGIFPGGAPPLTNQLIDAEAAEAVITGDWPTPIAWVDGTTGITMLVGQPLCTEVEEDHPMRIVYEELFACGPPGDGNWDAPTLLYAVGDSPEMFSELGKGGAAVLNESGGLTWEPSSERTEDVYIHVADEAGLKARIEALLIES